jgi:hypothetical protein
MVKGLQKWIQTLVIKKKSKEKGLVIDGKLSECQNNRWFTSFDCKILEPYTFHL